MKPFQNICIIFVCLLLCLSAGFSWKQASDPPDVILHVTLSYTHPQTGEKFILKTDSEKTNAAEWPDTAKKWSIPAGVELNIKLEVWNIGDNPGGDGFDVDLWYDWNKNEYPDDWEDADYVCLPDSPRDCLQFTKKITIDPDFPGKDGKGIYNIAAWVDRFDQTTEVYENNNFLGPIQIKPAMTAVVKPKVLKVKKLQPLRKLRMQKQPIKPELKFFPFRLEPSKAKQGFSFEPNQPANVRIRIEWRNKRDQLQAVLRDETNSRVLNRAKGKSPLELHFKQLKKSRIEKMSVIINSSGRGITAGRIIVHYFK